MYVTKNPIFSPDQAPSPCDTFSLGEHPVVVVEGFEGIPDAVLEISTQGNIIWQQSFPLQTGHVENTSFTSSSVYTGSSGGWITLQNMKETVNAGLELDLGVIPAGTYDLALKTNNAVAAVARFTVVMPVELANELQKIQAGRLKLEEDQSIIKQLGLEIQREKPGVDL